MPILSVTALKRAVDQGSDMESVAREILRYGSIIKDKSWDVDSGYHAGAHRVRQVSYSGLMWRIVMHNGALKSLGYSVQ